MTATASGAEQGHGAGKGLVLFINPADGPSLPAFDT